ncbi:hypothetical protein SAMN06265338_1332 [Rhodoblastus acidophilus]|uniref:Uncharacterized protein n=1 Tax=Rhodoblastus acidophilus TaxID=1074 RepID=A0A212SEX9_RHOAC|nr:hypothetical protein [Rhodoblastus acidophilus]PPQ34946.1 hypothetical protein CKO16_21525 [Rhodoblastus acidophilus]RAI16774.1 hypothetical protein CH337_19580 [Rhodoblastus acidophilus]SNB84108.1 hypothetical protein SAMN06265338_1332 [Rhodoblastus acidophilus]
MHIEMTFYNDDHPNKYNEVFFIACLYNEPYLLPEFVSKHSHLFGDDPRLDLAIDFTDIDLKDIGEVSRFIEDTYFSIRSVTLYSEKALVPALERWATDMFDYGEDSCCTEVWFKRSRRKKFKNVNANIAA